MTLNILELPLFQATDANGAPLAGGKLYSYLAGTSTPQALLASDGTTPLSNPVILDAAGMAQIRLPSMALKLNLLSAANVQQNEWPVDQVLSQPLTTVPSYTVGTLPTAGTRGRLAAVTDSGRGLWLDGGTAWAPVHGTFANVKDFGAVGDGSDATAAVTTCLAANQRVYFPAGTYLITGAASQALDGLKLLSGHEIFGDGPGLSIIKQAATSQYALSINQYTGGTANVADNARNISIHDVQLLATVDTDGFSQHYHLLNINAASDVLVERVLFKGFRGDGLYIGSGNLAGTERHNQRITVRDCRFDGVGYDTRNGISVIDCDGLTIENCTFANMAKSTMPGAIDLEPDALYNVIQNVRIDGNTFTAVHGSSGVVSLFFKDLAYTTHPSHITITNNRFAACTNTFALYISIADTSVAVSTNNHHVVIAHNTFNTCTGFQGAISGVKDVLIQGNLWVDCTNPLLLGYVNGTQDYLVDAIFQSNQIIHCHATAVRIGYADRLALLDNHIENATPYAFQLLQTALSSNLTFRGNVLNNGGGTMTYAVFKDAGHTVTPASTIFLDNTWGGLEQTVAGYLCDTTSAVQAFDTTTLPDSFPAGVSMAIINGDTGAPDSFHQGVLCTYRYTVTSGYRKFVYQTFKSANNDQYSRAEFWYRNAASATNTWDTWQRGLGTTGGYPDYTTTNVTTDRSYDANATTTDELADVLGTLIADLINAHVLV